MACTSFSCRRLSTGRTCRQPEPACAYQVPRVPCFSKIAVSRAGVVGQMLERHRAILDEGDRFALLLHRHHDVEAGGAHVGDGGLQFGIEHLDHAAPFGAALVPAEAEIADQVLELAQPAQVFLVIVLAELDQQDGGGRAAHEFFQRRPEHRDLARQLDHGAVDQLDRDRPKPHDVLGGIHRLVEAAEVDGADRAAAEQRRQLQFDAGREAERAFGADQHMREVDVVLARHQRVEIVAADAALHLREARGDLVGLARADREQVLGQRPQRRRHVVEVAADAAEMRQRAVRQQRLDRDHVVAHGAVAHRAAAAGIVAGHAADGGARGGGDIDREPQPVRLELAVEIVEHDAGLDRAARALDVEIEDAGEIFRAIHHQRFADGLPGLRGAAAARQHAGAFGAGNPYRPFGFFYRARGDHADRHDLVMRGVGGIAAAGEAVELHVPAQFGLQPPFQAGHDYRHGVNPCRAQICLCMKGLFAVRKTA